MGLPDFLWLPCARQQSGIWAMLPNIMCCPTLLSKMAILEGVVCNGENEDVHFWNAVEFDLGWYHIDLTWQQFPAGSRVREFFFLDRKNIVDSNLTKRRCALLLNRVEKYLSNAIEN
jgi:hypothetical protein